MQYRTSMRHRLMIAVTLCAGVIVFAGYGRGGAVADAKQAGPGATISGRVTYTDGRGVDRYPIEYRSATDRNSRLRARTDTEGNYTIEGLADGIYFIGFFDPARVPVDRNPQVEDLPDVAPALARSGAPKTRRVTITDGQSVAGVDFVLTDTGVDGDQGYEIETGRGEDMALPAAGASGGDAASEVILPALGALGIVALLGGWFAMKRSRHRP